MNPPEQCLFIGGPCDGRRVVFPGDYPQPHLIMHRSPSGCAYPMNDAPLSDRSTISREDYLRMYCVRTTGVGLAVYRHASMSEEQAVANLINRYPQPLKD